MGKKPKDSSKSPEMSTKLEEYAEFRWEREDKNQLHLYAEYKSSNPQAAKLERPWVRWLRIERTTWNGGKPKVTWRAGVVQGHRGWDLHSTPYNLDGELELEELDELIRGLGWEPPKHKIVASYY